ncbi:MAG: phage capsid protein [Candidatus Paceibacterota bacterium]|jgi:A118 family predicted phage portal protein
MSLLTWIKDWWSKMFTKDTIKTALGVEIDVSNIMTEALKTWSLIYQNKSPWLTTKMHSLNLGATIASEIARSVTIEMSVKVEGSARADYLKLQLEPILARLREKVELGCALGGLMMKPYPKNGMIAVDFIGANSFYPVAYDSSGNITSCVFADRRKIGDAWYTRFEYHNFFDNKCVVKNAAFKSTSIDQLGSKVALTTVPDWAGLEEEALIELIDRPLFAYFRYPAANTNDPDSPLGPSCFARAVTQLEDADDIYTNLVWEFRSGKRKMYVNELAIKRDDDNNPYLPKDEDYIRTLASTANIGETKGLFDEWSPEFREAAINAGLNSILKRVEFLCGLAYGTLSDPETVDKTATEILSSKQRSAATIVDTQKSVKKAISDLLYAMSAWCDIEGLVPAGAYKEEYDFDDSLITDRDKQFSQDGQTVGMSAMPKVTFLMRNYKLDEPTAKKWLADAQAEQPEVDLFQGA